MSELYGLIIDQTLSFPFSHVVGIEMMVLQSSQRDHRNHDCHYDQ